MLAVIHWITVGDTFSEPFNILTHWLKFINSFKCFFWEPISLLPHPISNQVFNCLFIFDRQMTDPPEFCQLVRFDRLQQIDQLRVAELAGIHPHDVGFTCDFIEQMSLVDFP